MHSSRALATPASRHLLPAFAAIVFVFAALVPDAAHASAGAGGFDVPFIRDFGCSVVQWLKGPLAILIFILTCVATLVLGMITKMDWARIITVCVIFGIVIGLGSILSSNGYISNIAGMASCLR